MYQSVLGNLSSIKSSRYLFYYCVNNGHVFLGTTALNINKMYFNNTTYNLIVMVVIISACSHISNINLYFIKVKYPDFIFCRKWLPFDTYLKIWSFLLHIKENFAISITLVYSKYYCRGGYRQKYNISCHMRNIKYVLLLIE